MFYNCTNLKILDGIKFETKYVTDMSYMFFNCASLTEINLNSFNTSEVTTMQSMFSSCTGIKEAFPFTLPLVNPKGALPEAQHFSLIR